MKKTEHATGNVAHWKYGTVRIQISMPESAFTNLKIAALQHRRKQPTRLVMVSKRKSEREFKRMTKAADYRMVALAGGGKRERARREFQEAWLGTVPVTDWPNVESREAWQEWAA